MAKKLRLWKFFSVLMVLVLVAGLGAVMGAPSPAKANSSSPTTTFVTGGTGTATWSTEQAHSGSRSAKLATITTSDRGMVRFEYPPYTMKLDDLTTLSYWEYVSARENPLDVFIDIWLDFDGDGDADVDDYPGYLQAEPYYTVGAAPLNTWTSIDAMNLMWSTYAGPDDPYHAPTIYHFQEPATFPGCLHGYDMDDWTGGYDFGQMYILRVDVRVGYGGTWANFTGYADDIVINSFTQGFEALSEVWVDDDFTSSTPGWGYDHFATIQNGINAVAVGGTVNVASGTYTEAVTITPGSDLTIQGAGRDVTTWIAPADNAARMHCIKCQNANNTTLDISGFTFSVEDNAISTAGIAIDITWAATGPLYLNIYDNKFIETTAISNETANSMQVCHNRFATRGAEAPVKIYNNLDYTAGGIAMSNSRAFDVYNNTFDGGSDAIYIGYGCSPSGITFGDHHIYDNIFMNADDDIEPGGPWPAIQFIDNGTPASNTILPSTIEKNTFEDNDSAICFLNMNGPATYPTDIVRYNSFINNLNNGILVTGTSPPTINAEHNWWGDAAGPSHDSPVTYGDKVSANVDYMPWLIATYTTQTPIPGLAITTTSPLPGGVTGIPYSQALAASGGTSPYKWYPYYGFPAWLSIDETTGVLSGTPTNAGTCDFEVQVHDADQGIWKAFQITVAPGALSITTASPLPQGDVDSAYSTTLEASGGTGPGTYSWSVISGSLPTGLSLNASTGEISSTPTAAGDFNFGVQVDDGTPQRTTKDFALKIWPKLVITTTSLPDGDVGTSYSQTVVAIGGRAAHTWSTISGDLPDGLSLNTSTGLISGIPTVVGDFSFTAQVTDGFSTVDQPLSIKIWASPLSITTISLPEGEEDLAYSATLQAAGGTGTYTWSKYSGTLPPGLSLNSSTGAISNTPTTAGTYDFTAQVQSGAQIAQKPLSIQIYALVTITTTTLPDGEMGTAYSQAVTATGGKTPFTWSQTGMPSWLSINPTTGIISGTPTSDGTFVFTVKVTDALSVEDTQSLNLKVWTALNITTTSLPDGKVGDAYSQALSATGGKTPYTWSKSAGNLPTGLDLNADGTITGTPTTAGTFNFTAQVADGIGTDTQSLSIEILPAAGFAEIGAWRGGMFILDYNGNGAWDGTPTDKVLGPFGLSTDTHIIGDWNNDGTDQIGFWRGGMFILDYNGNGAWDGTPTDHVLGPFGLSTDKPIIGDWNNDGTDEVGAWRSGMFILDYNGNGVWDGTPTDKVLGPFGLSTDAFIVGDWNNDGTDEVGAWRSGMFILDYNGNGAWDGTPTDKVLGPFGLSTDKPIVGYWGP